MKKNIKIFLIPIIAIVMLLVVQAFCDLALPEYTSSIINDGIGHNGITNEIPEVLPEDIFNAILKISNNDLTIKNSYILVAKENLNEKDFNHYAKKYPILKNEIVYILDDLTDDELNELKDKIREPLIISTMFKYNSNEIKGMLNLNEDDLLNWLMNTDAYTFEAVLTQAKNSLGNLDQSLLSEYSVASIKEIYEDVGININDYQMSYIISTGLKMLSIAFLGLMVAIILSYLISKLSSNVSYVLRNKVVNKIMSFSTGEFKEFGASSLITRSTNDIEQVRMFFNMFLRIVIFAPIMGIGAFIKVYDNPLNWLIAIALILILVLISILFALVMPKFKRMQKIIDKMNLVSREIITGMPVIRTFHTEEYEEKRFDKANNTLTKTNLFVNRVMNVMMPSMMLVMNFISIFIIWFGAKQIDIGALQVGSLLAFITYTMQIIMSFLMISMVSVMLPRAIVSFKRINELLKKESSIKEPDVVIPFKEKEKGTIEFKDVSFKYPDADEAMLKNISFKATPGTTTAFIGSTGSGKSTLINLIPRFFDVTEGSILVDGVDIRDASLKELRDRIGFVPQKGILFSGTIESNLKLGNDNLSNDEMLEAAKVSQSLEFIEEKDKQFKSPISQGGNNVSGGQKQRLAIARAIAKNPEIYIFDDSFSALDFKTDSLLRKALMKHAKNATVLIVAQRISTIMNADNIIVLNEGEIVGAGTHKELLKNCQIYKEIALSQLKEEEL